VTLVSRDKGQVQLSLKGRRDKRCSLTWGLQEKGGATIVAISRCLRYGRRRTRILRRPPSPRVALKVYLPASPR
jgi:hypothetical protein